MVFSIVLVVGFLMVVVRSSKKTERNYKVLLYIFLLAWGTALVTSSFGFFDMEIPSDFSYFLLLLHLVGFTAGALTITTTTSKQTNKTDFSLAKIENNIVRILNSRIFRVFIIFMAVYVTYVFSKYWVKVLFYQNISDTREQLVEIYGYTYYTFAKPLLFLPTTIVCYVLFGYSILKKRDWFCFLMGYYLVVNASLTGARFGYVYIAMGVVFANLFVVKVSLRKHWPKFAIAVAVLYGLIVLITTFRSVFVSIDKGTLEQGAELANEQIVTYFVGPQAAFDYALENDYLTQVGGYGLGSLTFAPVVNFVDFFTDTFLGFQVNTYILRVVKLLEDSPIYLEGGQQQWNALYTAVLFYYFDGGVVGVFVFPFFLGLILSILIRKMLKSGSVLHFALCGFFFICMIKSLLRMEEFWRFDSIALVTMFIIGNLKIGKHGNKQLR